MKKNYLLILALFISVFAKSQDTIRFESFNLAIDSFWNGSDRSGGFTDYSVYSSTYLNNYDTTYNSWEGFAYSNKKDTVTAGYTNQYSCVAGEGVNSSETYVLGYVGYLGLPTISFPTVVARSAGNEFVRGLYVNNSTYAYLSMKNGDGYGKKFGDTLDGNGLADGTNGNDWLKLTIYNAYQGDSVEFYLADFRFTDSADDYIIKDWTFVDLSNFNNPMEIKFKLTSSDNDPVYGMKTPAYFCIDNIVIDLNKVPSSINEISSINFNIFPNPTTHYVTVNLSDLTNGNYSVTLFDVNGREIKQVGNLSSKQVVLDMSNLNKGNYFIKVVDGNKTSTKKIIKL